MIYFGNHTSGRNVLKTLFIFIFVSMISNCNPSKELQIQNGLLQIDSVKFSSDRPISLDGEWNFYWRNFFTLKDLTTNNYKSMLMPVPRAWNEFEIDGKKLGSHGFATYHLKIVFPDTMFGEIVSLRSEYLPTAYRIFIDDDFLYEIGKVGVDREHSLPRSLPKTSHFQVKSKEMHLILHISNFHHRLGGPIRGLFIGNPNAINDLENSKRSRDLFSVSILGIVFIYYFIIWIVRREDRSSLYLSLLCFLLFMRALVQNQHFLVEAFPSIQFQHELLIEYLAMYWSAPIGLHFFSTFRQNKMDRKFLVLSYFIAIFFSIFAIITPTWIYTFSVLSYQYVIILTILLIIYILISAMRKGNRYALYSLISVFVMFATVVFDILIVEGKIDAPFIGSYGLVAMIIAQGIILAVKFSEAFGKLDIASQKLSRLNESLEEQIQERTGELKLSLRKAERASAFKSEFLASMSHEIRTPMNAILGMADLLSHTQLNEEQKHFLDIFSSSSKTLLHILNDILDLSKIENGNLVIDVFEFNPRVIVHDVVTIFELRKQNPNVTFHYQIDMNVPTICYGDGRRITQILFNLLSNSFKFTKVGKVELKLHWKDSALHFQVSDTGIGIASDKLDNLFMRFYQAHATEEKEEVGTGLGLYITKRLVSLMQGNIEVESELDKGTTFSFSIPIMEGSIQKDLDLSQTISEKEIRNLKSWPDQGPKILIVDDVQINLLVAKKLMNRISDFITASLGGKEVIEIFQKEYYDIVLLDLQMPELDGFQLLEIFREIDTHRDRRTPIIAFTANVTEEEQHSMRLAGFDDILAKPIERKLLLEKMFALLR